MFAYSAICDVPEETLLIVTRGGCGRIGTVSGHGPDAAPARRNWCWSHVCLDGTSIAIDRVSLDVEASQPMIAPTKAS